MDGSIFDFEAEISAHMRKDPGYLARMHMEVLGPHDAPIDPASVDWSGTRTPNFTVRQQSGAWNALGSLKIDMPNSYSVYMHDTNQKNLFTNDYRFDSHGCARVDNVRDLAAWLLARDLPQWNRARSMPRLARVSGWMSISRRKSQWRGSISRAG